MTQSTYGTQDMQPVPTATPPARLAVLRDATVQAFMEDLRKFVVHRSLAATLSGAAAKGVTPASALSTEVRDLREWLGWSDEGRTFLGTLRDDEHLIQALSTYRTEVTQFSGWVSQWQSAVHRGALEELSGLQRGFRDPQAGVAPDAALDAVAAVPSSWLAPRAAHQLVS